VRLPRVRFTARRLMAAVAVVALILAVADQLRRRRESFQQHAEVYRQKLVMQSCVHMSQGQGTCSSSTRGIALRTLNWPINTTRYE
jgi:hypothetical protein